MGFVDAVGNRRKTRQKSSSDKKGKYKKIMF